MIKDVPLAVYFNNRMVIGPSVYRVQYYTLVSKRAIRIITNSIVDEMCIAVEYEK